jgi:hypothetical protein
MILTTETINPAPDIIKSLIILRLTLGSALLKKKQIFLSKNVDGLMITLSPLFAPKHLSVLYDTSASPLSMGSTDAPRIYRYTFLLLPGIFIVTQPYLLKTELSLDHLMRTIGPDISTNSEFPRLN